MAAIAAHGFLAQRKMKGISLKSNLNFNSNRLSTFAMNRILSNIWLLVGIVITAVVVSAITSYFTCKWHWFGRSGAIVTMVGVILSVRPVIRMGFDEWVKSLSIIDGGHFPPTPEEIECGRQAKLDAIASHVGIFMALIGTLVWAYGDLIGGLP